MGLVTVLSNLIVSICTSTVILLLTHSVFGSLDYPYALLKLLHKLMLYNIAKRQINAWKKLSL